MGKIIIIPCQLSAVIDSLINLTNVSYKETIPNKIILLLCFEISNYVSPIYARWYLIYNFKVQYLVKIKMHNIRIYSASGVNR